MGTAPFFASLLLCWRGGLAGETGAGALIIYFLPVGGIKKTPEN